MTDAHKVSDGQSRAHTRGFNDHSQPSPRDETTSVFSYPQGKDRKYMKRGRLPSIDEDDLSTSLRRHSGSNNDLADFESIAMQNEHRSCPETSHLFVDRHPRGLEDRNSHSQAILSSSNSTATAKDKGPRQGCEQVPEAEWGRDGTPAQSAFQNNDFHPEQECQARRDFYNTDLTWLNGTIIIIVIVSTALSGLFAVLAMKGQRYNQYIGNGSEAKMSPATAILLTSVIAKIIELSFITGFVAFLGQVFSRRAFMKGKERGVTLSELTMWRWLVQPGTIFQHWETTKYAVVSFLGGLSLLSTILSTLYAPAATALVQPMPRESEWHTKIMGGSVKTDFANVLYVQDLCHTPIRSDEDYGATTCMQIENAGRSYYNLATYLADWDEYVRSTRTSKDQEKRPAMIGTPYVNSTVIPQWTNVINTTEASNKYGRMINNVSLALPHIGVPEAANNKKNRITQPGGSGIGGAYSIWASVPSPVFNVLCVSMNEEELAPIVYDTWNDDEVVDVNTWMLLMQNATTMNSTVVDDIFGWANEDKKSMIDYPPVFARYPMTFNTILNHTSWAWGRPAMYMLGQGGREDDRNLTGQYSLCKFQVDISVDCSTLYTVNTTGSTLEARCADRAENMAYIQTRANATSMQGVSNWRDIGFDWANSLSLNTGMMDANASNARILMMLQLANKPDIELSDILPSLAETLAVSGSYSVLSSWRDVPFFEFWNYSLPLLDVPATQYFKAKVKLQEYASGGVDNASKGWLVILILTFLFNLFVLSYFLLNWGLVTDFSQPPNLFTLAMNSPPSKVLAGSCGGGPEGKEYRVGWFVSHEGGHLYLEPEKESMLVPDDVHAYEHVQPNDPDHITSSASGARGFWKRSGFLANLPERLKRVKSVRARANPPRKRDRVTSIDQSRSRYSHADYELQ